MSKHKKKWTTLLIWLLLLSVFFLFFLIDRTDQSVGHEPFATFLEHTKQGRVSTIYVHHNEVHVELNDGSPDYVTLGVVDEELTQLLSNSGARVVWGEPPRPFRLLLTLGVPMLLLIAFLYYFIKKAKGANSGVFTLGKSRARLIENTNTTFADVGGCQEAKEMLGDVIDFLRNKQRWTSAGARLPRGVLLEGPPGCGKTLLAKAVAGETKAGFYTVSASEFVELFVGVGAARVRDMFETAAKNAPSVIFIDELDAVGRRRGSGIGAGHDEREQTLNQLLVCLDGFERDDQVVVLAATNRSDILDPALLRPGRFDRRVCVPPLSLEARQRVLEIHTRGKSLADDFSAQALAQRTEGFTGAQLESLVNEATLLAVRRARHSKSDRVEIGAIDFAQALVPLEEHPQTFDKLDTVLIESVTQLAQPTGKVIVHVELDDGQQVQGEVVWADAAFVKIRDSRTKKEFILGKQQWRRVTALNGTESASMNDIELDRWSREPSGVL